MGKRIQRFLWNNTGRCLTFFALLLLFPCFTNAQQQDTLETPTRMRRLIHNVFSQVMDAVTVTPKDSTVNAAVLKGKSVNPFAAYEGKVIRRIETSELGFEKTFGDTSRRIAYFGTKILNAIHKDTREWVIRSNIFINEGTRLSASVVADNERYLRTINFIQDARIVVKRVRGSRDSVDLVVITKDLFSLSAGLDVRGISRVRGKVADNNLLGMGQQVQFSLLADRARSPILGYEFLYTKTNIGKTFTNASIGYTVINSGRSHGNEDEKSIYFRLDRPLYSQYSKGAGGFEVSYNASENLYRKPDSQFLKYQYNLIDGWAGINFGVTKLLKSKDKIRDRSFLAVRYLNNHFGETPYQIGKNYDVIYNSRQALLSELTLFRQDFVTTNYIYGFGTTEDVPYGYNIALTGGWYKQLQRSRAYLGVNANRYYATDAGAFMQFFIRGGGFVYDKNVEDVVLMTGGNLFSRLLLYRNLKIRQYLKMSATRQINRTTFDALRIDNPFGLNQFRSDTLAGRGRISLYSETTVFTPNKAFGFKLAPFVFGDMSLLTPEKTDPGRTKMYAGIGAGIRARNENLVFGTMECRFIYFPRPSERTSLFKIAFRSNLRFRYNSLYVKAPETIQYNVADPNLY
jgi:hypothetical protein